MHLTSHSLYKAAIYNPYDDAKEDVVAAAAAEDAVAAAAVVEYNFDETAKLVDPPINNSIWNKDIPTP